MNSASCVSPVLKYSCVSQMLWARLVCRQCCRKIDGHSFNNMPKLLDSNGLEIHKKKARCNLTEVLLYVD